jgi:proteasome assembly chaperone (PAC2) family protein
MAGIEWKERPVLNEPVALIAFSGWGDAGEAASMAAFAFLEAFGSDVVAVIDSDDYFDFQVRRPVVEIEDDGIRQILWPDMEIHAVRGADRDMVVVVGEEPHYRWKRLSREIVGALQELGVKRVISIGAFVGQVAHTLPVPLIGSSNRPEKLAPWGLMPSNYEGPTGIIGVLTNEFGSAGIEAMSVWAAVPHYLSNQEYPPATEALALKVAELLGIELDSSELEDERRQFLLTVEEAIAANDDLVRYVQRLEEEAEGVDTEDSLRLVEEIERFLRDQAP